MPCDSSHMEPTQREEESACIIGFLKEVGLPIGCAHGIYGNVDNLDRHTRMLCDWCSTNDVTTRSLELQIWWRDHQKADAAKSSRWAQERKRLQVRMKALRKLTPAEIKALNIRLE